MNPKLISLLVLSFISTACCSNILLISILSSPSHHFWNGAIISELAGRGHNVTIISPYIEKHAPANVHYIHLENEHSNYSYEELVKSMSGTSPFYLAYLMELSYVDACSVSVRNKGFQTLLNYPNDFKFDLVLYDFVVGACFLPFVHKFNYPPMIAVTSYKNPTFLSGYIGGHNYYAYVPHNSLDFDDNMTFSQRLLNFMIHIEEYLLSEYYTSSKIDSIMAANFEPNLPSVREIEKKAVLALVNSNPIVDYAAPLPVNVIPVGGLHIKQPKSLPTDLKAFIDASKKGAVIFSLGSNFHSDSMPQSKKQIFLNVFADLSDYHFLWKYESNDTTLHVPKNVLIRPWLPVSDILADANVKAIMFHGGQSTTQEAVWRGVPIICMPFILDQTQNLIMSKRLGMAEGLDYHSLSVNRTKEVILQVLTNPSYKLNALRAASKFRDQKEPPMDRAIWWIEWVLRNPDSDYLKSPVLRLGIIAGNAYDIITFIVLFFVCFVIIAFKLCCFCIRSRIGLIRPREHTYKKGNIAVRLAAYTCRSAKRVYSSLQMRVCESESLLEKSVYKIV